MSTPLGKSIVTLVGGGNSAHTLIPLLSDAGHIVNLLTRQPEKWSNTVSFSYMLPSGEEAASLSGRLKVKSDRPEDVIPECDVVILSLPVSKYRRMLDRVAPFINRRKKVYIGTVYGQGGFNWMVDDLRRRYGFDNIVTFACGLLPWITRTKAYGSRGINYGPKAVNVAAVSPREDFAALDSLLLNDMCYRWFRKGCFQQAANFISLTLSVDNQIIHLSRMYGLYLRFGGKWKDISEVPLFYGDYDELSAKLLGDVDNDYTKIRERIKALFPDRDYRYMLNYLDLERLSYNSANTDIRESFTSSKTLGQIPTPTVQNECGDRVLDKNHRFFTDDVYYGQCIAKWIAEKLAIETETIDRILGWAQGVRGDRIIDGGRLVVDTEGDDDVYRCGIPSAYGYSTVHEIID